MDRCSVPIGPPAEGDGEVLQHPTAHLPRSRDESRRPTGLGSVRHRDVRGLPVNRCARAGGVSRRQTELMSDSQSEPVGYDMRVGG